VIVLVVLFYSFTEGYSDEWRDREVKEIKNTIYDFFSVLIKKDMKQEALYFDWEDFNWAEGQIGKVLGRGYLRSNDYERERMRNNFLYNYNIRYLYSIMMKVRREVRLNDLDIVSVERLANDRAVVNYIDPLTENRKLYVRKKGDGWLIYEIDSPIGK